MERPHVRLAVIAKNNPTALQRTVDSVRHLIDSALVVIAPRAYASLPNDGFGYCSLETKVVQSPALASMTRADLVRLAESEPATWVLVLDEGDTLNARLSDLPFDTEGDLFLRDSALFVRARVGWIDP